MLPMLFACSGEESLVDDIRPKPETHGVCKRCRKNVVHWLPGMGIVSPGGIEHIGTDGGDTLCGVDATGPNWWWPL